jgi:ferredoxin
MKRAMTGSEIEQHTALVLNMARTLGASSVGITTKDTMGSSDPTASYEYVLKGARSAVTFAVPFGNGNIDEIIDQSLAKRDHKTLETLKVRSTTLANGIAFEISGLLNQIGCEAVPVHANYVYRPDMPAEKRVPPLSHKLLALRGGVGYAGFSGMILTKEHGANIALASVVTKADLIPTPALPSEENYCDRCKLCAASCLSNYITRNTIQGTIGNITYSISEKGNPMRCAFVCSGATGKTKKAEWTTWSPADFDVPDDDESMLIEFRTKARPAQARRTEEVGFVGGFFHPFHPGYRNEYTCSLCQYVCHPDRKIRQHRFELIRGSGVSVPDEKGGYKAVTSGEAREIFDRMPRERRRMYLED